MEKSYRGERGGRAGCGVVKRQPLLLPPALPRPSVLHYAPELHLVVYQHMPINCARLPPHKSTSCDGCGVCKQCPNDECTEFPHPSERGSDNSKRVQALYKKNAAEAPVKDLRRNCAVHPNLNEDALQLPITKKIEEEERIHQEKQRTLCDTIVQSVQTRVNTFSLRDVKRVNPFDADQLRQHSSSLLDAVRMVDAITDAVYEGITGGDDAARRIIEHKALKRSKMSEETSNEGLRFLATTVLTEHDELNARRSFAVLAKFFNFERRRELIDMLNLAPNDVKQNPLFLSTMRPIVRWVKSKSMGQNVNDDPFDDDIEPEDEDSSSPLDATQRVEISPMQQLENKAKWGSSRFRMRQARTDAYDVANGQTLQLRYSQCRVRIERINGALEFIIANGQGWRPALVRNVQVGGQILENMPVMMTVAGKTSLFEAYEKEAAKNGGEINGYKFVGQRIFGLLFDAIAKLTECKASLSYYFTDGLHAITLLEKMLKRACELYVLHDSTNTHVAAEVIDLKVSSDDLLQAVQSCTSTFKYELRAHMILDPNKCDGNALHCCAYAVGVQCNNTHDASKACVICANFARLVPVVKEYIQAIRNVLSREFENTEGFATDEHVAGLAVRELDTMFKVLGSCSKEMHYFHCHVARGAWQMFQMQTIADELHLGTMLLLMDHKMKVEPSFLKEGSDQFYGKKGISLLGSWLRFRKHSNSPLEKVYFDTVVSDSEQNAEQVQAVLTYLIRELLPTIAPLVRSVIIASDNGAAFSNQKKYQVYFLSQSE